MHRRYGDVVPHPRLCGLQHQQQKVWQNKNGRPMNVSPIPPPASVTINELSSTVSMLQETIAVQGRLLAESEHDCQPILNDAVSVDPNRTNIARTAWLALPVIYGHHGPVHFFRAHPLHD